MAGKSHMNLLQRKVQEAWEEAVEKCGLECVMVISSAEECRREERKTHPCWPWLVWDQGQSAGPHRQQPHFRPQLCLREELPWDAYLHNT